MSCERLRCRCPSSSHCTHLSFFNHTFESRSSSVSIVSGYGLDDRAIDVRSPAEAIGFSFSFCVQTGSGSHPVSCPIDTGGPFSGAEARPGRDADHSPHILPRSMVCCGTALAFSLRHLNSTARPPLWSSG
jgi:hypothetical protein